MNYIFRTIATAGIILSFFGRAFATHTIGGGIYYTHLHDSTYKITLELYYDCKSAPVDLNYVVSYAKPLLLISDTLDFNHNLFYDTLVLQADAAASNREVLRPCFTERTQCTDPESAIIGIKKYVFSAEYIVKRHTGNLWFVYEGYNGEGYMLSGRVLNTTNIDAEGRSVWLACGLNTTTNNSNALVARQLQPYYCLNAACTYTPAITDADGDSISVALIKPVGADGATNFYLFPDTIAFKYPYSINAPLAVAPGTYSLNSKTGDMLFTPSQQQRALLEYQVSEYRNGKWAGSSMRELAILVTPCKDTCTIDTLAGASIKLYPSPADKNLYINMTQKPYNSVTVYDILGRKKMFASLTTQINTIYTGLWEEGIYLVVLDGAADRKVEKLLIRH
jgi:hypothetical protein